jgi:hypothetical protein
MKNLQKVFNVAGSLLWIAVLAVSFYFTFYRFITGDGDPFVPLIVIVLFAINFNLSSLLNIKIKEREAVEMILEKSSEPPKFTQNPYLN